MRYPHLAAALYTEPWQILPAKFSEIAHAFEKARATPGHQAELPSSSSLPTTDNGQPTTDSASADTPVGPSYEDTPGRPTYIHPQIETHRGLALARIHGTTGRRLSMLAMQCGGYDTGLLRQQLRHIYEDPTIHTLLLDIHSPGGQAAGNLAVAQDLRALSDRGVRVIAYTEALMCSAAYFIASGADEIHAHPDAIVGSISTIYAGEDNSAQWAMEGRTLKLFATGKFKATGMDGKPWTPEEEENIWSRIKAIDSEFKGYVRARRPGVADSDLEGQWWYAKHAPNTLIDSTRFDTLASLVERIYATR